MILFLRYAPLMLKMVFGVLILCAVGLSLALEQYASQVPSVDSLLEFNVENITDNLRFWEADLTIMFYAPWCKYCKSLTPSYEQMAQLLANEELIIGKVNCEESHEKLTLCHDLGITKYPTLKFIGFGNFNQAPSTSSGLIGSIFSKPEGGLTRVVEFTADMYVDSIYDWIRVLHGVSWAQRTLSRVTNLFWGLFSSQWGNRKAYRTIRSFKEEVGSLKKQQKEMQGELSRFKAIELFNKLENRGDPFPLLHMLEPDKVSDSCF